MIWADETHLPAWPAGADDGRGARLVRVARDAVRRLTVPPTDRRDDDPPLPAA